MKLLLPWVLFLLALIAAIFSTVHLFDAAVELDSARSEASRQRARNTLTLKVIRHDWVGSRVSAVEELSRKLQQEGVIVGTEDEVIEVGDLLFESKQGTVTDVNYIGP